MHRSVDSSVSAERRALENAARQRAQAEAELVEVRILREHRARMAALAEQHRRELEAARAQEDHRARTVRRWAGVLVGVWIAGFGLAFAHASAAGSPAAAGKAVAAQVDSCGVSSAFSLEQAHLDQRLSQSSQSSEPVGEPVDAPVTPAPVAPTPVRPIRVVQPTTPAPAVEQCNDAGGDPCCAFGKIVC